jgi:tetratricopeptide (TPR) repeat protein
VFDRQGRLVGLIRARIDDVDSATLLAPVNDAYELLRRHGLNPSSASTPFEALQAGPEASDAEKRAVEEYNRGVAAASIDEKIEHYRQAALLRPELFEAWFNLGVAYTGAQRLEDAVRSYRRAEALRPSSVETQRNLGRALLQLDRLPEVEECFKRAVVLAPKDAGVQNDLGELYRRRGRFPDAAACFKTALGIRPDYAAARYNLGLTFMEMERWSEAIASFESYLRLAPDASDIDEVRGMIKDLEGKQVAQGKGNGG